MLRSGLILGIAGPAALLTLLVHPTIRENADLVGRQDRLVLLPIQDVLAAKAQVETVQQIAAVVRSEGRPIEAQRSGQDKASSKLPRRLMKEGCEGAISSLAGPEARRMLPGRCIA